MDPQVYKIVEIVGTSGSSIEDAIQSGITRAAQSIRKIVSTPVRYQASGAE